MPLILAIEPDRRQATRVAALAPTRIDAEIVVVHSVDAALAALDSRVPDLVLTPSLLSPKDDAALTAKLRELDSRGCGLQTLVIPVLASGPPRSAEPERPGGLLNRIRRQKPVASALPDGCDPDVFAAQIGEYLARSAAEKRERDEAARPTGWMAPAVTASAPMLGELLPLAAPTSPLPIAFEMSGLIRDANQALSNDADQPAGVDDLAAPLVDVSAPVVEIPEPVVGIPEPATEISDRVVQVTEPVVVMAAESTPSLAAPPAGDEPLPPPDRVKEKRRRVRPPSRRAESGVDDVPVILPSEDRTTSSPSRPTQDEWGLYDPEQCGFAALLNRLDEITAAGDEKRKHRKRSAIMRR